jgi:hypothetical protein
MVSYFRVSPASRPLLRIGLLLDNPNISAFSARILEDIQASNFAKIVLAVYRKTAPPLARENGRNSKARSAVRRLVDPTLRKQILYSLYLRLDRRMRPPGHPLDIVDCAARLERIPSLEVEPIGRRFIQRFPAESVEQIRAADLDVLIRFGFNILHGDILNAARYGVWSYHHGDNVFYRGGPSHFWELYERNPLSGVILQVLTEELDAGLVLCKSLFPTEQTISVSRNRFAPYWGSAELMIRKLNELHQHGWDYVRQRALPPAPYLGKRTIYRTPTNADMLRWLGPVLLKKTVQYPFRQKKVQHWRIGIRQGARKLFESDSEPDLSGFRWIEPPKGYFWADPFPIEYSGKRWVFFEEYSYEESRGWISSAEISSAGDLKSPLKCLDIAGRHLSYPHVLPSGDDLFMIPESCDSDAVRLYRCQRFPGKWVAEATLLHGRFVDTTVWKHQGLWWLMTTTADPDARCGSLLLFYSESLLGDWHFHPANPISTDIRRNRGAGRVFWAGHGWIRPSQSCSPSYGYSFALNEITELSTTAYSETTIKIVNPANDLGGVHTYNHVENVELIDSKVFLPVREVLVSKSSD